MMGYTIWPVVSDNPQIQADYVELREAGRSHNMADMLAHAQPPGAQTDREFLKGHVCGSQFEKTPQVGDYYKGIATEAGVDTTGKVYLSGLAASPGDPRAWVSDRSDVQKVCEERGWNCDGAVKVRAIRPSEAASVGVAPDILARETALELAKDPNTKIADVQEKVKERITPHWAK